MIFYFLLALFIFQRLLEVQHGEKNFANIGERLVQPVNLVEKKQMIALHTLWFLSNIIEYAWRGELVSWPLFYIGVLILLGTQYVRYLSMKLLGESWVHLPIAYHQQKIVNESIYRYLRHPNYSIVAVELAILPLLGKCFYTAIIFSTLNIIFIWRRVKIEEAALYLVLQDKESYVLKKRFVPFLFSVVLLLVANLPVHLSADEIFFNHKNFKEAKNAQTFFRFIGKSTKVGIFSTNFEGQVLKGVIKFQKRGTLLEQVELNFNAADLDTESESRNEKMWNLCLEIAKYPKIQVLFQQSLETTAEKQTLTALLKVRDQEVPVTVDIEKTKDGVFKGKTRFNFHEAKIPDPSIAVASLGEVIKIDFQVQLR